MATRWSPYNAKCLCFTCHRKWHENPVESFIWVEGYLGEGLLQVVRELAQRGEETHRVTEIVALVQLRLDHLAGRGLADGEARPVGRIV